jgi:REP element-mobilizing transposase RayT
MSDDFKALLAANEYYHVFNRAVGKEKIFIVEDNYRYFFQQFSKYISPISDLFCYSLLPNHFHFFLRMKDVQLITSQMKTLNYRHGNDSNLIPDFLLQQFSNCFNAYTKAFNKQQKRKGKLFMEPFNRKSVTNPEYYTKLVHYVHANAVHHGLCKKVKDWPYSSYHLLGQLQNGWLQCDEVIRWFGSVAEFIKFHEQPIKRKFADQ